MFFLLFIGLLAAYSPGVFLDYAYFDDYLFGSGSKDCPQYGNMIKNARPIGLFIVWVSSKFIHTMRDVSHMRFISFLHLTIAAFICYRWLCGFFNEKKQAFLFSIIIFTLPPLQMIVSWVTTILLSTALLLSVAAAVVAKKVSLSKRFSISGSLAAVFLFLGALMTYQQAAMFFWVMAAIFLLGLWRNSSWSKSKRPIMIFAGIGFCGLVLYVGYCLWAIEPSNGILYRPADLPSLYAEKIVTFFKGPLVSALNLWSTFHSYKLALGMGLFILTGYFIRLLYLNRNNSGKDLGYLFVRLGLSIIFIVLSFLPNLASTAYTPAYRYAIALAPIVAVIVLLASLDWLSLIKNQVIRDRILTVILLCSAVWGMKQAYYSVLYYRVLPAQKEYAYITSIVRSQDLGQYKRIVVLLGRSRYNLSPLPDYFPQEIIPLTTDQPWFTVSMLRNILMESGISSAIVKVNGKEALRCELPVSDQGRYVHYIGVSSYPPEQYQDPAPYDLVIDMNKMI